MVVKIFVIFLLLPPESSGMLCDVAGYVNRSVKCVYSDYQMK